MRLESYLTGAMLVCAMAVTGCSSESTPQNPKAPTQAAEVKAVTDVKPRICLKNGTDTEYYFGVFQKNFGRMKSKQSPNAKFCTVVKSSPELFVRLTSKGQDFCKIKAKNGMVYTLTEFKNSGDCTWSVTPQ